MSAWNYWHVYDFMKSVFLSTGVAPDRDTLLVEFKELDSRQIDEGIEEFELAIGRRKRGEVG